MGTLKVTKLKQTKNFFFSIFKISRKKFQSVFEIPRAHQVVLNKKLNI